MNRQTGHHFDLDEKGRKTREVLAAQAKVAHAFMASWPNLPREIPTLLDQAASRRDVLTNEVYQVARTTYELDPLDRWYSWIWPMEYKSGFPAPVHEPENFDIVYVIGKCYSERRRTWMGRPDWWMSRLNEAWQSQAITELSE